MPRVLYLFLCLLLIQCNVSSKTKISQEDTLIFPASWVGEWQGQLDIYKAEGKTQSIPMELHVLPIDTSDSFTWTIIYGEDKEAGKRAYLLETIDAEKGIYRVDEQNTIAMEAYYINNTLFSRYSVMDNLILITTEKKDNQLIFEVLAGSHEPVSTTGGKQHEGEDIPKVDAFPIGVMQRAILKKKKI